MYVRVAEEGKEKALPLAHRSFELFPFLERSEIETPDFIIACFEHDRL